MANPRMTLLDLLNKSEQGADPEFLRNGLKLLAQELMDAEVTQLTGAGLHERSENRLTYRNGYRERDWETRVGTIELDIPKLRTGTYFPSLLGPRRRHERALLSVVQEAYVHGVSTRSVYAWLTGSRDPGPPCRGRGESGHGRREGASLRGRPVGRPSIRSESKARSGEALRRGSSTCSTRDSRSWIRSTSSALWRLTGSRSRWMCRRWRRSSWSTATQ